VAPPSDEINNSCVKFTLDRSSEITAFKCPYL